MHEMSLCESIREVLTDEAQRHAFSRVRRVRLEVGRFACVEVEALRFGFDVVMRGSVAEGAELVIEEAPGLASCTDCGRTVEITDRLSTCPACGGEHLIPVGGDAMRIKDLEVI